MITVWNLQKGSIRMICVYDLVPCCFAFLLSNQQAAQPPIKAHVRRLECVLWFVAFSNGFLVWPLTLLSFDRPASRSKTQTTDETCMFRFHFPYDILDICSATQRVYARVMLLCANGKQRERKGTRKCMERSRTDPHCFGSIFHITHPRLASAEGFLLEVFFC